MAFQIGNLDTRVRIERKSVTQDATYGTEVISWVPVAVVWAEVQDVLPSRSQAEQVRVATQVGTQRTRVRMRYRDDVDQTMRMVIRGAVYQIVSGPAEIGRHEWMEFVAERYSVTP